MPYFADGKSEGGVTKCTQPAPGRAGTYTGIFRAPIQSKALSKMTGHFLNTKNLGLDPPPFKRQGKERKENLLGHLLSPLPVCCLQAATYPMEICKVSCSCAQVRLPGVEQLLDVRAGGYAECRVQLPPQHRGLRGIPQLCPLPPADSGTSGGLLFNRHRLPEARKVVFSF